jgi:hypothetical protein
VDSDTNASVEDYTLPPDVTFARQESSQKLDAAKLRGNYCTLQHQQQQMPHNDTDHDEHHHTHHYDAETKVPLGCETNILAE